MDPGALRVQERASGILLSLRNCRRDTVTRVVRSRRFFLCSRREKFLRNLCPHLFSVVVVTVMVGQADFFTTRTAYSVDTAPVLQTPVVSNFTSILRNRPRASGQ